MEFRLHFRGWLCLLLLVATGCDAALDRVQEARQMNQGGPREVSEKPSRPRPKPAPRIEDEEPLPEIAASGLLYDPSSPESWKMHLGGVNEEVAVGRVTAYLRDAIDLDPTLVVWLFDRSPSATPVVYQASRHLGRFYAEAAQGRVPKIRPDDANPRLLTAVVTFGEDVQFPLEQPTGDAAAVQQVLESLPSDQSPRETTFAAVAAAVEKYLPYRTERGHRLLLVLVTDEAGDDPQRVDDVLLAPRKYGVPVYVIGAPAPFGRVTALPNVGEGGSGLGAAAQGGEKTPPLRHGPESRYLERVELPSFAGVWRNNVLESGFGPFALERLCRATGGEFILLQPPTHDSAGGSLSDWPSPLAVRFESDAMRRYTPDYVSEEAYQNLLAENGARMALHRAAQGEGAEGEFHPRLDFPRESEVALQRLLDQAQQTAARLAPQVDRIYDTLQQGEADRPKLTAPRWQAGFDLALGRAAAAKARIDGYNAMLAILKRGRGFEKADSARWVLQPADTTEAGSAVQRLIDKARTHLERVAAEHPNTPWARLASEELESKFGWQWVEQP